MSRAQALLFAIAVAMVGILAVSRQRQLEIALSRAQSRLIELQHELEQEQRARRAQAGCVQAAAADTKASFSAATVRALLRERLGEAVSALATTPSSATAADDHAELVRAELAESAAAEDAGWCVCPPLPDFGKVCRALRRAPEQSTETASLQAEIDALRALAADAQNHARASDEYFVAARLLISRAESGAKQEVEEAMAKARAAANDAERAKREHAACKDTPPTADQCAPRRISPGELRSFRRHPSEAPRGTTTASPRGTGARTLSTRRSGSSPTRCPSTWRRCATRQLRTSPRRARQN